MDSMSIQECREFVNSISDIPLKVKYSNDPDLQDFMAIACRDNTILLSRKCFMNKDLISQRACLLHEIGHYHTYHIKNYADRELYTELWAIKKANSLKMYYLKSQLISEIKGWARYPWNYKGGIYRSYRIANKKYKSMKGPKHGKVKNGKHSS